MTLVAVIAGLVLGSIANMGILVLGSRLILPPHGVDVTDSESIAQSIHLFELRHFVFPFLAHAMGTLVGAAIATQLTKGTTMQAALIVSAFFLAGGITNLFMLPHPTWFAVLDIGCAYLPMGLLGRKLVDIAHS